MLLESIEIKKLQPDLNKSQKTISLPHKIIAFKDRNGYMILKAITGKNKSENHEYIKSFRSKNSAKQYIGWIIREYALCQSINDQTGNDRPCFLHTLEVCHGACIGRESAEEYNKRVWQFIDARPHFDQQDFIIVDRGRSQDEHGVIIIQNGEYYGYGYITSDRINLAYDEVISQVKPQQSNDEVHAIIWHYIQKKKGKIKCIPRDT